MSRWSADNTNSNKTNETTSTVKEEEVPRTNTTTTPTPQRLEQALEAFVGALEGFKGTLLKFEEALLEPEEGVLKEGALKEGAPEHQNDQNPRLLSPSEVCQELGEERTVVYLQDYMNRQHHLRLVGEEVTIQEVTIHEDV
jgi:hypothetical protein